MNKAVLGVAVVLVLLVAGVYFFAGSASERAADENSELIDENQDAVEEENEQEDMSNENEDIYGGDGGAGNSGNTDNSDEGDSGEPDVTFVITGENFKFVMDGVDNPDLVVNEGDLVRIEFTSTSGFHDWVLDEFEAATAQVRETEDMTFVEFVADQKGTFEYYCSVGSHRAAGMKGQFIVE